jgi:hypothetical protein
VKKLKVGVLLLAFLVVALVVGGTATVMADIDLPDRGSAPDKIDLPDEAPAEICAPRGRFPTCTWPFPKPTPSP